MSYILAVDDEEELLEIIVMSIEMAAKTEVIKASSGEEAIKIMETKGPPRLIISDFKMSPGDGLWLYEKVKQNYPHTLFAVCSGNPLDELEIKFKGCYGIVTKPKIVAPIQKIVKSLFETPVDSSETKRLNYIRIPSKFLLSIGVMAVDTYIQLSPEKFVKLYSKGDSLDSSDIEKFKAKSIEHFYVTFEDGKILCDEFEKYFENVFRLGQEVTSSSKIEGLMNLTLPVLKAMGWNQESVDVAIKTMNITVNMMKNDTSIAKILASKNMGDEYSRRVSLLSMLVCIVSQELGWSSGQTQHKLVAAAMLHDYFLEDEDHAAFKQGKTTENFHLHPVRAAELAKGLKNLPSDVDHIVLQHHEKPDGSGFPRGLSASQISPLAALFIICEELVDFCDGKDITVNLMNDFWEKFPLFVQKEPFKKIASSIINCR